jgi:single-strand DNA-binding protein
MIVFSTPSTWISPVFCNECFHLFCSTQFYSRIKCTVMIKLQVIGNLGKDASVNNVNGKNVINFTVAHTERFKDAQGNQKDRTTWVDCAYWTDRTAIAPYLKKGTQVYVEGTPDVRTYTTQDGRNGASLTLRIVNVQLLGSRNNEGGNASSNYSAPQNNYTSSSSPSTAGELTEPLDDLPF